MKLLKIFTVFCLGFIIGILFTLKTFTVDSVEKDGKIYKYLDTQFDENFAVSVFVRE